MTSPLPRIPASTETVGGTTDYRERQLALPEQGTPPSTEPLPRDARPSNSFDALDFPNIY